jgi:hypothetical protein
MRPRDSALSGTGVSGTEIDGCECSSSTVRSIAPAARCSSPHISDNAPTDVPMKMA